MILMRKKRDRKGGMDGRSGDVEEIQNCKKTIGKKKEKKRK